jgi:hypothetical protein
MDNDELHLHCLAGCSVDDATFSRIFGETGRDRSAHELLAPRFNNNNKVSMVRVRGERDQMEVSHPVAAHIWKQHSERRKGSSSTGVTPIVLGT